MKTGIIISVIILIVLGAVITFFIIPPAPEGPTKLTKPENLEKIVLPAGLPVIFEPDQPEANANELYKKAFDYYLDNKSAFVSSRGIVLTDPPAAEADKLAGLIEDASKAAKVNLPFLDDMIPMQPKADPEFKDALETIPEIVCNRAKKLNDAGDWAAAMRIGRATWVMGQRALEKSVRLYNRRIGLSILMGYAGPQLFDVREHDTNLENEMNAWASALDKYAKQLEPKVEFLYSLRPHQGDLINMARHEKDPGLRSEAILMVGVVKFNAKHAGNLAAFERIMTDYQSDPDPLIAQSAKAASAFTRDQMRKLH